MDMKRRAFLLSGIACAACGPAWSQNSADHIVAELQNQGYHTIRIYRTWLRRIRIVADGPNGVREIVYNPSNGMVLRDYVTSPNQLAKAKPKGNRDGDDDERDWENPRGNRPDHDDDDEDDDDDREDLEIADDDEPRRPRPNNDGPALTSGDVRPRSNDAPRPRPLNMPLPRDRYKPVNKA